MTRVGTTRRPAVGVLLPGAVIDIGVDIPIEVDEQPVVLTKDVTAVLITGYQSDMVTLENHSNLAVPYILFVVPKAVVGALRLPWPEAMMQLLEHSRPFLAGHLGQILRHIGGRRE